MFLEEEKEANAEPGDVIKSENVDATDENKKKLDNGADNSASSAGT